MAVVGVGVDMVSVDRMKTVIARTPAFVPKVFTDQERAYCDKTAKPHAHYAARFAAREAVLKALGCGFKGVRFSDVEVVRSDDGRPQVVLHNKAKQIADEQGIIAIHLSLSFSGDVAVANALAVTPEALPKKETKVDPKQELAASFREVRSVLDDLERISHTELDEIDKGLAGTYLQHPKENSDEMDR